MTKKSVATAAVLNTGDGACFFAEHARRIAQVLGVEVREEPAEFNYLLAWDEDQPPRERSFIPYSAIIVSADKRLLAQAFAAHQVATPQTHLLDSPHDVQALLHADSQRRWALKWPTGCGGAGHRLLDTQTPLPPHWPLPYVVQEFIQQPVPEVYRLYCVAGVTFGWNARRFPPGPAVSPFVAHARGARYEAVGDVPAEAETQARGALAATGLLDSFGCVDLLRDERGRWLVLEANTDGVFSHVDRDIGIGNIAQEIDKRLAVAFWDWATSEGGYISSDAGRNNHEKQ